VTRLDDTLKAIRPLDPDAMAAAQDRLDHLTKPPGSLGRLEELAVWLAGVTGTPAPPVARRRVVIAAADHGVAMRQQVSAWPSEVTAQMVSTFLAGRAAISTIAAAGDISIVVLDVGVASPIPAVANASTGAALVQAKVRPGTADFTEGPAMTSAEAAAAIEVGLDAVDQAIMDGVQLLGVGEMGIGNTTSASAVVAALTGRDPREVTGRGTGVDDDTLGRKIAAVEAGLARLAPGADAVDVVAEVGGLEIAALSGFVIGGAAARTPVVIDGVIALAGACVAAAMAPDVLGYCVAGHRSTEPGATAALEHLGLEPLLDLGLRLGEGTGACLAVPLLVAAARVLGEMATFDGAGVTQKV